MPIPLPPEGGSPLGIIIMDLGSGIAIFAGCAVIIAAIIKLRPKDNKCDKYMTRREVAIWREGFDRQWEDLRGWISSIQKNVETLIKGDHK